MTQLKRTDTARRVFQGKWISRLLNNFETTQETQEMALATLWTVLETGFMRTEHILKTMGIEPDETISCEFSETLLRVKAAVRGLIIPVDCQSIPFMVCLDNVWTYNRELLEWETAIIDEIADNLPMIFPSSVPAVASEKQYIDGTWVIKHSVKRYKDQSVRTAPEVFAALNVLNAQAYVLNQDMLNLMNMPEDLDRVVGASPVHRLNRMASMKAFSGTFHFKYTMDFRGRIYARSVLATPQGDSFAKAALDLASTKKLGKRGVQALAIHFANQSGYDKESYVGRIQWATGEGKLLAERIAACRGDYMRISQLLTEPDNFEQYTAAMDWHRCMTMADPKEYESRIVCHQDATNSGFQFGAALLKDRTAAEFVNITNSKTAADKPADLYGVMAENTIVRIQDFHKEWVAVMDRKFCKKPIMVTGYGAGELVVTNDILDYMEEKGIRLDFEDIKEDFFLAMNDTVGSMTTITEHMKAHAKYITEEYLKDEIVWTTPDGLRIYHHYRDSSARKVKVSKSLSALRKRRRGEIDPLSTKMIGALPPNFIHSMDGQLLRYAALHASFNQLAFCPIHDSFGTHAADYWELHGILKDAFIRTMEFDWYGMFCKLNNVKPTMEIIGDYDLQEARSAAYMFS